MYLAPKAHMREYEDGQEMVFERGKEILINDTI